MRLYQVCYLVVFVFSGVTLMVNAPDMIQSIALVLFLVSSALLAVSIPFERSIRSVQAMLDEDDENTHERP